ncbi:MAG: TetR family transcriptional regulator C-terminal domain-containing protein [Flavobacteriaceae bacterium]|nr:TetR family transcriptional regulator C-terminal domain-containing protein [Flavobacteriaceae bacterium]MDG2503546.1 TetR family transcriptional regulator C-terminal domain-containing protein [Flavobacteriaceae bacterium]
MAKKNLDLKNKIFEAYSNHVLEHEKEPKSVFMFCKKSEIIESDFYQHFSSLEHVKEAIFVKFFDNAFSLISKEKNYEAQSPKEKLLSFYYTFFEVLLLNRSYVLFSLSATENKMQRLMTLKSLRHSFKEFASTLIEQGNMQKQSRFTKHPEALFSEGAWVQLLFLLKFWMEDKSAGFEKTDMAIEKSVQTVFELFDNTPLDSIIDFGKFLWKENFKMA